ncbi:MAG: VOC family protein [Candidatus Wallbacteria bacterium]
MFIEHIAVWVDDLEAMKDFYELMFNGKAGKKYVNVKKNFESYFITFDGGARVELMKRRVCSDNMPAQENKPDYGYAHMAFRVGSEAEVDIITEKFQRKGIKLISGPRRTGDGYYESCIEDPEGNLIEIVA